MTFLSSPHSAGFYQTEPSNQPIDDRRQIVVQVPFGDVGAGPGGGGIGPVGLVFVDGQHHHLGDGQGGLFDKSKFDNP